MGSYLKDISYFGIDVLQILLWKVTRFAKPNLVQRTRKSKRERGTCPGFCSSQVRQAQNFASRLCSNAHLIISCKVWKMAQEGFRGLPAQKILALSWNVVNMGQWIQGFEVRSPVPQRQASITRLLRKSRALLPHLGHTAGRGEREKKTLRRKKKKRLSVLWS